MNKQELEAQRVRLNAELGNLVESAMKIEEQMKRVPRKRGMAHRSLGQKVGLYIIHGEVGFQAYCEYKGQEYEIKVFRRNRSE